MTDLISEIDKNSNSEEKEEEIKEEEEEKKEIVIPKELQENVVKYVKLDDLIKEKQQELAELKEKQKPCDQYIVKYLDTVKQDEIGITNGKIKKNKSETKSAINQELVKAAIAKKIGDSMLVQEILNELENSRAVTTKVQLKRTGGGRAKKAKK
jgi:hypothetical protein